MAKLYLFLTRFVVVTLLHGVFYLVGVWVTFTPNPARWLVFSTTVGRVSFLFVLAGFIYFSIKFVKWDPNKQR